MVTKTMEDAEKPNRKQGDHLKTGNKRKLLPPLSREKKGRCRITGAQRLRFAGTVRITRGQMRRRGIEATKEVQLLSEMPLEVGKKGDE